MRVQLGPGLIFAAAAVGTSHVVQSTRAGAGFGLTLIALIAAICVLKYPLFRFAADYAAITDESLVQGYGRRGRWLVVLMFGASAIEAVAATAGISLVSASILKWMSGLALGDVTAAVALLLLTSVIIALGRYRVLESLTGILVLLFSVLTLVATAASLPALLDSAGPLFAPFPLTAENWSFAIAVSGWMPIGNSAAIMLAAWVLARHRSQPDEAADALAASRFDFNLGYVTSAVLALCFVVIGASVLFRQGVAMPAGSAQFVASFVNLYAATIGDWSTLVVSSAALAVMYSSLLAVVDGFPRLLSEFLLELRLPADRTQTSDEALDRLYPLAMAFVVAGASALLYLFLGAFAAFIDLVTIIGFLTAPLVALANQLVISGSNVPAKLRPGSLLLRWNQLTVVLLGMAAGGYLLLRFG